MATPDLSYSLLLKCLKPDNTQFPTLEKKDNQIIISHPYSLSRINYDCRSLFILHNHTHTYGVGFTFPILVNAKLI